MDIICLSRLELGRCRYFRSVSVFGIFSVFFKVGIGIGILKYRDIGIGIRITDPGLVETDSEGLDLIIHFVSDISSRASSDTV